MILNILKNIFILFLVIFTFQSCSNKKQNVIGKNSLYKTGLEYTQVKDLVYANETKAILNLTYLNITYPNKYDNKFQNFLLGIYIVLDDENKNKQALSNENYILSLNGHTKYKKIQITKNNKIYENIPIKNPYAKYYLVSFKKNEAKTLNIEFSHKVFGQISITNKAF